MVLSTNRRSRTDTRRGAQCGLDPEDSPRSPDLGIRQDDIRPGLRCKPARRNDLVFYELEGDTLRILRVLHGARKYDDLL